MLLASLRHGALAFGHVPLLVAAELVIEPGERLALIGRNGCGKSSLLKALAGQLVLDEGELWHAPGLRIAHVPQEPSFGPGETVFAAVAAGLGDLGRALQGYHEASAAVAQADDASAAERLQHWQELLDAEGGWAIEQKIEAVLDRFGLKGDDPVERLSGGWQKRVALARALIAQPKLLLLDEPTNHLDIEAMIWLEGLLRAHQGAVVCVTHDRRFLDAVATRVIELDRGRLGVYPGSFAAYQERKAREWADEAVRNAKADRLLAQEEVWIRKGVEARRTRAQGRIRRLEELRAERAARRERWGDVRLGIELGERSGQLVAELEHVDKGFGGPVLISNFSTRIFRGDRVGLIGPNGVGKSTLLKLLLGELEPDRGRVRRGTNLQVAYFDQLREQLDPQASLTETISPGADFVTLGDTRKHVISYLGDFLFAPERARSPVRSLSGGERNRLLLARLFSRPANVLVLDEPTNDLDLETLELLEDLLRDYSGTIFLVSHDRAFLDNVVTQVIAFEGDGQLREYVGGYSDWVAYREEYPSDIGASWQASSGKTSSGKTSGDGPKPPSRSKSPDEPRRLSAREEQELAQLPGRVEALEAELASWQSRAADPALYRGSGDGIRAVQTGLAACEQAVAALYRRWEELESRRV